MDNAGYSQDPEKGTELNLVDKSARRVRGDSGKAAGLAQLSSRPHSPRNGRETTQRSSPADSSVSSPRAGGASGSSSSDAGGGGRGGGGQPPEPGPSTSCRPEVCQRARERYTAPDLRGSPWHRSKTIFLLICIGALVVWAIVYSTLGKYNLV